MKTLLVGMGTTALAGALCYVLGWDRGLRAGALLEAGRPGSAQQGTHWAAWDALTAGEAARQSAVWDAWRGKPTTPRRRVG